MVSEEQFNCVLGKDYHIINNNVDNMTYYLQEGNDVVLVINLLNRLVEENEQLKKENRELNSIKKFAEKNGINIFLIDEAFRKCWKDNGKLFEENELLKQDNQRQKTLRNKHWREIQARANAYNRIISSLENRIPHHIVEELRNAPLLDCDYEGVESNE